MQLTILCVDDQRDVLRSVGRTLRKMAGDILAFEDPRRAIELLQQRPVDVIVSDIDMPSMSGLELLRLARELRPEAARVVVSGVTSIDSAVAAINDGAVHRFVRKPYVPEELRKIVAQAVDDARISREAATVLASRRQRQAWRQRMEAECPDALVVQRDDDGAYLVDLAAADELAPAAGLEHIVRVWSA